MTDASTSIEAVRATGPEDGEPAGIVVLAFTNASTLVVLVAGHADAHTAPVLRERLLQALVHRRDTLVIDVADLQFCDLRGLDALDDGVDAAEQAGMVVTFRGMWPRLAWLRATFP